MMFDYSSGVLLHEPMHSLGILLFMRDSFIWKIHSAKCITKCVTQPHCTFTMVLNKYVHANSLFFYP